jgi:hypothetical protein
VAFEKLKRAGGQMEEQWNVIYVDRISGRELTSRTLDSREAAFLHASELNRNHDEVLRITDGSVIDRASIFEWIEKNAV